jgi:hypothetical protein
MSQETREIIEILIRGLSFTVSELKKCLARNESVVKCIPNREGSGTGNPS